MRRTPATPLLTVTDAGLYCADGGFHVDPWHPVDRALITHAHADHARQGSARYLATDAAGPVLRHRLGDIALEGIAYGGPRTINGVTVSFHPAGHVPGSAQIRIERGGEVWVVSGDYKLAPDGLSEPFEPVTCHTFITESTFGLPVFRWPDQAEVARDINAWWRDTREAGMIALLGAYSLGKAQRVLSMLDPAIGPILTHGAVGAITDILRAQGYPLPDTIPVTPDTKAADYPGALVVAPPGALGSTWARRFGKISTATASGWMRLRGVRRRRGLDRGFVLSDHADWDALNRAVAETGASRVMVTHGYTDVFSRHLAAQGLQAEVLGTQYGGDEAEDGTSEAAA